MNRVRIGIIFFRFCFGQYQIHRLNFHTIFIIIYFFSLLINLSCSFYDMLDKIIL